MKENDFPAQVPSQPGYRTIQIQVPVISRGAGLAALAAAALVAVAVYGGWSAYQHHLAAARRDQARQEMEAAAQPVLARDQADLNQAENDLRALSQEVQGAGAATRSQSIDVNDYMAAQNGIETRLGRINTDLAGLDQKQTELWGSYRLHSHDDLLTPAERQEAADLRQREQADTLQVAALNDPIQAAAQHRQALASSEAAARERIEEAAARRAAAVSEEEAPPQQTVYYSTPVYGYPYSYDPYYRYGYYNPGPSIWIGGFGFWGGHGGHFHHH